ncbi:barstar family protein [uncultured Methanobrevibacter sp.]|uniref:barstar family protein n=1 Tax=uncultured Methanobrevibacter sp. TaxID=253161 RepID=UPI00260843AD|nr:barstar family protein [uncultured Methanobrevibacter sp.]
MRLDGKLIQEKGHDYLMDALDFPDYYGKNLDALYDCLCEMDLEIEIVNAGLVDKDIIDTFKDAAAENDFLKLKMFP